MSLILTERPKQLKIIIILISVEYRYSTTCLLNVNAGRRSCVGAR